MSRLAELKKMETEFNTVAEKLETELNYTRTEIAEELKRTELEKTSKVFQLLMDYVNEYNLKDSDYYKNMIYIDTIKIYTNSSKTGWYYRDIYIGHRYKYDRTNLKSFIEIESRNRASIQTRCQIGTIGKTINIKDAKYNELKFKLLNFENEFLKTFENSIADIMQKRVEKKRLELEKTQNNIEELKDKLDFIIEEC